MAFLGKALGLENNDGAFQSVWGRGWSGENLSFCGQTAPPSSLGAGLVWGPRPPGKGPKKAGPGPFLTLSPQELALATGNVEDILQNRLDTCHIAVSSETSIQIPVGGPSACAVAPQRCLLCCRVLRNPRGFTGTWGFQWEAQGKPVSGPQRATGLGPSWQDGYLYSWSQKF
jgi:hypothetical protein